MSRGDADLPSGWFRDYRWKHLTDAAKVVHLSAHEFCWHADNDGLLEYGDLAFCGNPRQRTIDRLLLSELWKVRDDGKGFVVTDYLVHQLSKEKREAAREASRRSTRKGREQSRGPDSAPT